MRMLLGFLLIFSIVGALLLGVGTGVGFLLHWLIPAVDLGIGILIGVITIAFTAQLFARIVSMPLDEVDAPPLDEAVTLSRRVTYLIDPEPQPRRRRRKQTKADSA
jgi:hypothetical protein